MRHDIRRYWKNNGVARRGDRQIAGGIKCDEIRAQQLGKSILRMWIAIDFEHENSMKVGSVEFPRAFIVQTSTGVQRDQAVHTEYR